MDGLNSHILVSTPPEKHMLASRTRSQRDNFKQNFKHHQTAGNQHVKRAQVTRVESLSKTYETEVRERERGSPIDGCSTQNPMSNHGV